MAEANLVYDVAPKYPPEAGRARIEGTVVLLAVIGKDGTVEDVSVVKGLPVLAQAAIEAVKQWRYRPYLLNGAPVEIAGPPGFHAIGPCTVIRNFQSCRALQDY